ncbi:ankyrin repeat domain-containing protein [Streptomyces sp. YC504]|uniref:Ankyrin repeat domain-containing protein n=1 Tax=Streptomyces mesophilus TaxID=1775132 RepID=A0A6G4XR33_9ACTN|nr:ankyrin repeat domain-containing protein [Streptomyces mesophilus]NGO79061.1 ankyrin repeat domain-containing protein [Streptomyces mesophilus]
MSDSAPTEDGLPVLCAAVAAYDLDVARALIESGADPDLALPDGTTPLIRAVEAGSPAMVAAVLGRDPGLRLPASVRESLLGRARQWHERGAEAELRRRTGASGPVRAEVVEDEYDNVTQLSLAGHTVRAGHLAILTGLEWTFRILTPVDELVARAVSAGDPDDVTWTAARWVLGERRSRQTWSAVTAYRHDPDPLHRRFVVDVLRWYVFSQGSRRNSYDKEAAELLTAWVAEGEDDPEVLAAVLDVLSDTEHGELEAVGLGHVDHPAAVVRARVPSLLLDGGAAAGPAARVALLALARDEDSTVRAQAGWCLAVAHDGSAEVSAALVALLRDPDPQVRAFVAEYAAPCPDRTPAVTDALADLVHEGELNARLNAVHGLLLRDDPRTDEAIESLGTLTVPRVSEHDHRVSAIWTWRWERNPSNP